MSLKKLGRYDLIRVLGKGAMGLVYEGRDPNLDRRVAIKTIKVENLSVEEAAEYEVRFRTEARSAARLQHPNIVSVYDSDRDADIAFLVMEFIQGDDLKHHLDKGERFTLERAASVMNDLLSALDYAHRQNVVHRDVKPANLLIEPSGRVKLTDFGVARIQDSGEATRTQGTMVGTLKYMSPEQVQGLPIDSRSDLFAAGIVLYQLLTGKRPFDGVGDYEIIQQILTKKAEPPSSFSPNLPSEMDAVIERALEKSRDDRYATAHDFNAALQTASKAATDPTIAPPANRNRPGPNATWTSTLVAGEELVGTNAGSLSGASTSPSTTTSTVTQEVELVYWKEILDSTDVADFQDFVAKFPTGIYADLARRRMKRLVTIHEDGSSGSQSGTRTRLVMPDPVGPSLTVEKPSVQAPAGAVASTPIAQTSSVVPTEKPAKVAKKVNEAPATKKPGWALAAGAVAVAVVLGVVGFKVMNNAPLAEPAAVAPPAAESAKVAAAPVEPASAAAPLPEPVKVAAVASDPNAASKSNPPVPDKPIGNDGKPAKKAAVPAKPPAAPASDMAKPAPAPAAAPLPDTHKSAPKPAPVASAKESAAPTQNPNKECEGRWLIAFQMCLTEQCGKPQYASHAVCVERREIERRRAEQENRVK